MVLLRTSQVEALRSNKCDWFVIFRAPSRIARSSGTLSFRGASSGYSSWSLKYSVSWLSKAKSVRSSPRSGLPQKIRLFSRIFCCPKYAAFWKNMTNKASSRSYYRQNSGKLTSLLSGKKFDSPLGVIVDYSAKRPAFTAGSATDACSSSLRRCFLLQRSLALRKLDWQSL